MQSAEITARTLSSHKARNEDRSWLRRIGILNDHVRIPYANGSSFAAQFLYREFRARGHQVTVVGPDDPQAQPFELPSSRVCLPSLPLRMHPGVHLPLPGPRAIAELAAQRFDIVLGQTMSELAQLGVYLRATQNIPYLCVNTTHFPGAYNVLLPDALLANETVHGFFRDRVVPWCEAQSAEAYNQTDGLIVLSRGLERYWRERGVEVPIHVIPRAVEPKIFDRDGLRDPFDRACKPGSRLLCVCRHTREKGLDRLLGLFAAQIAPALPHATLTLVGEGPDHDAYRALAERLGVADRVFFTGELPVTEAPAYYRHADLFVYASLSETYGQVIGEALYCGLPAVAFADGMGVSYQIDSEQTGVLIEPGPDAAAADRCFGARVVELLSNPQRRRVMGEVARARTHARVHPSRIIDRYYDAFEHARRHCAASAERRAKNPFTPIYALGRWTAVQALAVAVGCIRSPATINRHGRRQPVWDERVLAPSSHGSLGARARGESFA